MADLTAPDNACKRSALQCYIAFRHELRCGHNIRTFTALEGCAANCKIVGRGVETSFLCAQCETEDVQLQIVDHTNEDEKHASEAQINSSPELAVILEVTTYLARALPVR